MAFYRPVIPPHVGERLRHLAPDLKRGIREAIRAIAIDPGLGAPLKRELQGYMKFRVRRYRIVYRTDHHSRIIAIMAIGHRRSVYEDVAAAIREKSGG